MKRVFHLILTLFAFVLIGLSGCRRSACDKINCENGSVCEAGSCLCPVGYEGSNCEILSREKFVKGGTYSVNEQGSFTPLSQYKTTIVAGNQVNEVKLQGVRDTIFQGQEVIATVAHDTIWIAKQVVNGYEIEGMGIIRGTNQAAGSFYYDDATILLTYQTKRLSDNTFDFYGTNGTQPSDWSKD